MKDIVILDSYKRELSLLITPAKVVLRKNRKDRFNYYPMLKSIAKDINVDKQYMGTITGNRVFVRSGNESIIAYFNDRMQITDYLKNNSVIIVRRIYENQKQ